MLQGGEAELKATGFEGGGQGALTGEQDAGELAERKPEGEGRCRKNGGAMQRGGELAGEVAVALGMGRGEVKWAGEGF